LRDRFLKKKIREVFIIIFPGEGTGGGGQGVPFPRVREGPNGGGKAGGTDWHFHHLSNSTTFVKDGSYTIIHEEMSLVYFTIS
jgi:hypothetical protein